MALGKLQVDITADNSQLKKKVDESVKKVNDLGNLDEQPSLNVDTSGLDMATARFNDFTNNIKMTMASLGSLTDVTSNLYDLQGLDLVNATQEISDINMLKSSLLELEALSQGTFSSLGTGGDVTTLNHINEVIGVLKQRLSELNQTPMQQINSGISQLKETTSQTQSAVASLGNMAKNSFNKMKTSVNSGFSSLKRFAIGLLGIRSAFTMITQVSRNYMSTNGEINGQMKALSTAMTNLLAPAINWVVGAFTKLVTWTIIAYNYIATFINIIFKTNLAIIKQIKDINNQRKAFSNLGSQVKKTSNELNELAGFDEFNIIQTTATDTSTGDTGVDNSFNTESLSGFDTAMASMNEEIANSLSGLAKFGEWVKKNEGILKIVSIAILAIATAWAVWNIALALWNVLTAPWLLIIIGIVAIVVIMILIWDDLFALLMSGINWVLDLLGALGKLIIDVFVGIGKFAVDFIVGAFTLAFDLIMLVVSFAFNFIKAIIEGFFNFVKLIVDMVATVFKLLWDGIKLAVTTIFNIITTIFNTFFNVAKTIFNTLLNVAISVWEAIKLAVTTAFSVIGTVFNTFFNIAKGIFNGILSVASSVWEGIKSGFSFAIDFVKGLFNSLKNAFSSAWNFITGLMSTGGKVFTGLVDGISNIFKSVVNAMIRGLNKIIASPINFLNGILNNIRDFNLPIIGKPFKGLWAHNPIPISPIPQLAHGAIAKRTNGGTQVNVGEGRNSEAIVPLGNSPEFSEMKADIARHVLSELSGLTKGGEQTITIHNEIGGSEFGRKVIKVINDTQNNAGITLLEV